MDILTKDCVDMEFPLEFGKYLVHKDVKEAFEKAENKDILNKFTELFKKTCGVDSIFLEFQL